MSKTASFAAAHLVVAAVLAVTIVLGATCYPLSGGVIAVLGISLALNGIAGVGNLVLWRRHGW